MEKTETGMVKVVGVRFRTAGKIYYFDPGDFELSRGSHVRPWKWKRRISPRLSRR